MTPSNETVLYMLDTKNNMRKWRIEILDNVLRITHGLENGSAQVKEETIEKGLGGRSVVEQVRSRYYSRINDQMKRGYKISREEAANKKGTNGLGFRKPMLAQPYEKVKNINFEHAVAQHKYDGFRCLVTVTGGRKLAYSRQGKLLGGLDHILDSLHLKEGQTVDGELYCHGVPLQTIASWVKREQDATKNIEYMVYDIISHEPYHSRKHELQQIINPFGGSASIVPSWQVEDADHVQELLANSIEKGYEGLILRHGRLGYEVGKRSKSLVKVKVFYDMEVKVCDIIPSKDGWARLVCRTEDGVEFKVTCHGTQSYKEHVLQNKRDFIGKLLTIQYANLTPDGVPFHPVALRWRTEL